MRCALNELSWSLLDCDRFPDFLNQPRFGRVAYANPNSLAICFSSGLCESSSTYGVTVPW